MQNKKGFTLIEIIVCIALISVIGTVIGVNIYKNNREEKQKKKLIDDVISATDVYFNSNSDIQEKMEINDGCVSIDFNELKEIGIIGDNIDKPNLTHDEINNGYSYDKILICKKDNNKRINGKSITLLSNDKLGVDILWPSVYNTPYSLELNDIEITNDEFDNFKCNTDIFDFENNKEGIINYFSYIDKNYKKVDISDYECGACNNFDVNGNCTSTINWKNKEDRVFYNNEIGEYTLYYKARGKSLSDSEPPYAQRKVKIIGTNSMEFKTELLDGKNTLYNCGEWTNYDVITYYNYVGSSDLVSIIWSHDSNYKESSYTASVNENEIFNETISSTTRIKSNIKNTYIENSNSCLIKIDKDNPEINVKLKNNNQINVTIGDEHSGIKGYYISNTKLNDNDFNNISWNTYSLSFDYSIKEDKSYYIYAKDNAGNIKEEIFSLENYPIITAEPIDGTISKFKVKVSGNGSLDDIKVQYTFTKRDKHDFYDFEDMPGNRRYYESSMKNDFNNFINDFAYDKNYAIKTNTKSFSCKGTSCEIIIDMNDAINNCYSKYSCKEVVDPIYLDNLVLTYYVLTTNKVDGKKYTKETKINATLNMDKKMFSGQTNLDKKPIAYVNDEGTIIYYINYRSSKSRVSSTYTYEYYYINKNQEMKSLATVNYQYWTYSDYKEDRVTQFYTWNDEKINYLICFSNFDYENRYGRAIFLKEYWTYNYNIQNSSLLELKSWSNEETGYQCNTNGYNNVLVNSTKFSNVQNYKNYDLINNFLTINKEWSTHVTEKYNGYYLLNDQQILNGKLIYTYNNGEYRYLTPIKETIKGEDDWYGILTFKEKVDLKIISSDIKV